MVKKNFFVQTKYGSHMIEVEPDERRGYIAVAPALPGVITWGHTVSHTKEMAEEAIELCIELLVEKRLSPKRGMRVQKSHRALAKV